MKAFLEYIADNFISKYGYDMSRLAVVFPNKRASIFLNEYLARKAGRPIWSPTYITISDLFRGKSQTTVGDQIKLICLLHKSFIKCTGLDETLDHFYGWGQLLLEDFDDLDKNMADAGKVFANLKDIHELDDISYLTDEQKEILSKFFGNFSPDHNSELKKRFISLWSHLGEIYHDFRQRLKEQDITYEGALYRDVVMNESTDFEYEKYIFIGFNVLQRVEQKLFERLQKSGKAEFYWDFDNYYKNSNNEAGHYISKYIDRFPNELSNNDIEIYDNFNAPKDICYTSAPTENIQARYISKWLLSNGRIDAGKRTAIVLCDENLLQTVIHSIPEEVNNLNITTGYPLSQSPIASLVNQLIILQSIGYVANSGKFRLHYINGILSHPYAKYISDNCSMLHSMLNNNRRYYPEQTELCIDEHLTVLFRQLCKDDESLISQISIWLIDIIKIIASHAHEEDPFFQESLFRMYTLINRIHILIKDGDLDVDTTTFHRLLSQLISSTSVPFHGEPAVGIQIMGVLETRNLDFDHVLILSCNEGNMPKGINDSSFIPYSIRNAYGLTTIDNKISIYSYYFHRLLQRASDITIMYNNSTENGHTGEMSRFMLQLMVESNQHIKKINLQASLAPLIIKPNDIEKDTNILSKLHQMNYLSPSAINKYMRCPLQFYYNYIVGINEIDDNDDDEIDNRVFGNIFHLAAQLIYMHFKENDNIVRKDAITNMIHNNAAIEMIVDEAFRQELFKIKDKQVSLPDFNGIQIINRNVIINYIKRLLELDAKIAPFEIINMECDVMDKFEISTSEGLKTIEIGGRIDRIDMITQQDAKYIRVIDYKTGNKTNNNISSVEDVFDNSLITKKHTDYFLQAMLYSCIVSTKHNKEKLPVRPALLYIQHTQADHYDPVLQISKEAIKDITDIKENFLKMLLNKVSEIFEPQIPFHKTEDISRCTNCPYHGLCYTTPTKI